MKNLNPSSEDAWVVFEAILDEKQEPTKSVLLALSPMLRRRYDLYGEHRMNLERILDAVPAFDEPQQDALKHCYESPPEPLKQLKQRIKKRQSPTARRTCQYCGINSPDTWDHYLPRAPFPEFSVHPDNLAPCCSTCNGNRGVGWRKDGERVHFNLYFDEIEVTERFLVAHLVFDQDGEPGATFEVDCSRGTNQAFARRYKRHFDDLKLCYRFEEAAPGHLARIALDVRDSAEQLDGDVSEIARHLWKQAEELQGLLGANNWEVALRAAAAESRVFIDYCLRPLPEHGEVST